MNTAAGAGVAPAACLIAGCGDIGMRVAALLACRQQRVYGLRRQPQHLPAPILPLAGDLTDDAGLRALPHDLDSLVYLATPSARSAAAYRQVYRDGLARLLDALPQGAAALRRIVFVSSSAVYGEHGGAWVDETTPCRPLAFNGEVLLDTEQWLLSRYAQACVLRFGGIYGPGRTRLIDQLRAGEAQVLAGPPRYSNRIHADDAAAATVHVLGLDRPASLYNVVDDCPAPLGEVNDWLAQRLALASPPRVAPALHDSVGNKRLRNARLRESGVVLRYPDYRHGYATLLPDAASPM